METAVSLDIPVPFTVKILQELVRNGIVSSLKGPGGGFYLSEKNLNLPLIEIVKTIDGLSFFSSCGLGLSECSEEHPCPIHHTFKETRTRLLGLLSETKVRDLSKELLMSRIFVTE